MISTKLQSFRAARGARRGFTLVELLVVVGMIAVILAALTTSITAAQERARIQKATNDVKVISQAILAAENFDKKHQLKIMNDAEADASSLDFLLGRNGEDMSGGKMPVLLMGALSAGNKLRDPWNTPYRVTIKRGNANVKIGSASSTLQSGFFLPNFYRLTAEERK